MPMTISPICHRGTAKLIIHYSAMSNSTVACNKYLASVRNNEVLLRFQNIDKSKEYCNKGLALNLVLV